MQHQSATTKFEAPEETETEKRGGEVNVPPKEYTESVAEFSEKQFARRRQEEIEKALRILCWELETEEDIRNSLANRLTENQKLATAEERNADGFCIIYGDLQKSKYQVEKLQTAIATLKAIRV